MRKHKFCYMDILSVCGNSKLYANLWTLLRWPFKNWLGWAPVCQQGFLCASQRMWQGCYTVLWAQLTANTLVRDSLNETIKDNGTVKLLWDNICQRAGRTTVQSLLTQDCDKGIYWHEKRGHRQTGKMRLKQSFLSMYLGGGNCNTVTISLKYTVIEK